MRIFRLVIIGAVVLVFALTAPGRKSSAGDSNKSDSSELPNESGSQSDDLSPKRLFYQTSYKKPTTCCPAEIHVTFGSEIAPESAEEFLREEIHRALRYFAPVGDIRAWAWRTESLGENVAPSAAEEIEIQLVDGSSYLLYVEETDQIETENTYYRRQFPPADPEKVIEVEIDLRLERNSSKQIRVLGQTNLPDEMILYLGVTNRLTGYEVEDRVTVAEGGFATSWFGDEESGLPGGMYLVSVISPLTQPESVREDIGENGENLSGDRVTASLRRLSVYLKVKKLVE